MGERLAALNADQYGVFSFNKMPKCPHCGSDFGVSENEAWHLYDENGPHDVTCPDCEEDFRVNSHADWRFSTDDQED